MDEIENIQNKYKSVSISQLEELIDDYRNNVQKAKQVENELIKENDGKLEALISNVATLKENLHAEHQSLEEKNKELLEYKDSIIKLKAEHDKFVQENQSLQTQKNVLKTTKPNQQDQLLLEQGRAKLHLYKELTGIHWDYSALKENVKGYVSNKHDYIHHFCFSQNYEDPKELSERLWNEIYLSVENMLNENSTENSIEKN